MQKKFKLEKVLEIRDKALEKEKIKLSELMARDQELAAEMTAIANDMKAKQLEMEEERLKGRYEFTEMYNKFMAIREQDFVAVAQKRETLNTEIAAQKTVLNKALNDLKVMERLKEKHLQDYAAFEKKQEEHQIDEINITRQFKE